MCGFAAVDSVRAREREPVDGDAGPGNAVRLDERPAVPVPIAEPGDQR